MMRQKVRTIGRYFTFASFSPIFYIECYETNKIIPVFYYLSLIFIVLAIIPIGNNILLTMLTAQNSECGDI